jgi:hypothetical protein
MSIEFLHRSIWQRIFGISATEKPRDEDGWNYESGQLTVSLARIPEMTRAGTAIRFEGKNLPSRVLVVCDEDKRYKAFQTDVPIWAIGGWTMCQVLKPSSAAV